MSNPRAYDDDFPTCERTYAELRIYPGDLSPVWVTETLGIEPTRTNERGKKRVSFTTQRTRTIPLNAWFLSSEGELSSKDVRRHLDWLLDRIEPAITALTVVRNLPGARMWIHCSWWSASGHGGPTLSPEQMRRMAAVDLDCGFEIMFFGADE